MASQNCQTLQVDRARPNTAFRFSESVRVLELCRDRARVDVELKDYGKGRRLEERVAEVVERTGTADQVILM